MINGVKREYVYKQWVKCRLRKKEIFALFSLAIASRSYMLLCLCESTIENIAFIILPFKYMAISSVDTEEPPSPVHRGFSVRKFLFRFVHNKAIYAEKW